MCSSKIPWESSIGKPVGNRPNQPRLLSFGCNVLAHGRMKRMGSMVFGVSALLFRRVAFRIWQGNLCGYVFVCMARFASGEAGLNSWGTPSASGKADLCGCVLFCQARFADVRRCGDLKVRPSTHFVTRIRNGRTCCGICLYEQLKCLVFLFHSRHSTLCVCVAKLWLFESQTFDPLV